MADKTEPPSTYSEASFVTTKNDLKHKFYRPDVSEMLVPVVIQSEFSTVLEAVFDVYRRREHSSTTTVMSRSTHNLHTSKQS